MILTQIAFRNARRARLAWSWPSVPVGLPTVRLQGVIYQDCYVKNFFVPQLKGSQNVVK